MGTKGPRSQTALLADSARWLQRLHTTGYPTAYLPNGKLVAGPYYRLDSLVLVGLPPDLTISGPRRMPTTGAGWYNGIEAPWVEDWLQILGQSGYPYAAVGRPTVVYTPNQATPPDTFSVSIRYPLQTGPYLVWGLPKASTAVRESPRWLAAHLGLPAGTPIDVRALRQLPERIDRGGRYKLDSLPSSTVKEGALVLTLPLARRKTNRFDALLGLLPPRGLQREWQLTALIDLQLTSALRLGERLALKYEQFPATSRRLDVRFELPYIAGGPFSGELSLNLYKQDSTFQTLRFEPTLRYSVSQRLTAELFVQLRTSGLLNVTPFRETVWPPPPVLDSRSNYTGLALRYDSRNQPINPSEGFYGYVSYGLGRKRIRRTVGLDSLDFERLALDQPKQEIRLAGEALLPVGNLQVLRLALNGYYLDLAEYFDSDLAQLGGARSLRGFNENQFLASAYLYGSAEYRLLLDELAYIGLFIDYGYLEQRSLFDTATQSPFAAGLALSVDTQAGLINVQYAVGQTAGQTFQLARGRVHIGYTASF